MHLLIKVNHPKIVLEIKQRQEVIDQMNWQDNNNTSTIILKKIEQILKRNNLTINELSKIKTQYNQKSFTATRIIRTVAKTINYCLAND